MVTPVAFAPPAIQIQTTTRFSRARMGLATRRLRPIQTIEGSKATSITASTVTRAIRTAEEDERAFSVKHDGIRGKNHWMPVTAKKLVTVFGS